MGIFKSERHDQQQPITHIRTLSSYMYLCFLLFHPYLMVTDRIYQIQVNKEKPWAVHHDYR